MSRVIEVVEFSAVPGVTTEALVSAAQEAGVFLARQPGFIRRQLAQRTDGGWIDIVEWSSLEAAQAAAAAFPTAQEVLSFMTKVAAGVRMSHGVIRVAS